jgi:hypothetical protein
MEEVKRMYADYAYYTGEFHGIKIKDEETFDKYENRAEILLDKLTLNRCKDMADPGSRVKNAVCEAAEIYCEKLEKDKTGIASENTDGYSVSYSAEEVSGTIADRSAARVIRFYLEGTGLLLRRRGWRDHECGNYHI